MQAFRLDANALVRTYQEVTNRKPEHPGALPAHRRLRCPTGDHQQWTFG
jgi:hypothetical protein